MHTYKYTGSGQWRGGCRGGSGGGKFRGRGGGKRARSGRVSGDWVRQIQVLSSVLF
jgi:hypothetical protein